MGGRGSGLVVCASHLRQKEVLQLLLLVRQHDDSSISVYHADLLNSNVQLQLNGPG